MLLTTKMSFWLLPTSVSVPVEPVMVMVSVPEVHPAKVQPGQRGSNATAYHDPFVLFGFLAGVTRKIGFAAGVLILAQRQAALVAKREE